MADRGILFSAPMVRALIAGTKTQDRRVLLPLRGLTLGEALEHGEYDGPSIRLSRDQIQAPRIAVGDRLYVREHWRTYSTLDDHPPSDITGVRVWYEADAGYKPHSRFRQGRHMPRWASRITLHVTDVCVQRLRDISEADAIAEGVEHLPGVAVEAYERLWDSINGPGSWTANP